MKKCHKKTCETASSKKSIIAQLQLWTIVVIPIDITNNRDTIYGSANTNLFFLATTTRIRLFPNLSSQQVELFHVPNWQNLNKLPHELLLRHCAVYETSS